MQAGPVILALVLLPGILLGGCSKDFGTSNMARYHDAGLRAELARDYPAAEANYDRALIWAGTEKVPPALLSLALYNLGRMKGHACKFVDARELLLTALALEEATSGPVSLAISSRLLELARLSYDQKRHAEALPYYAQAIPMLRQLNLPDTDPSAFTEILQEYAASLRQTGNPQAAEALAAEIGARRSRYADARPPVVAARYSACRGTTLVQGGEA